MARGKDSNFAEKTWACWWTTWTRASSVPLKEKGANCVLSKSLARSLREAILLLYSDAWDRFSSAVSCFVSPSTRRIGYWNEVLQRATKLVSWMEHAAYERTDVAEMVMDDSWRGTPTRQGEEHRSECGEFSLHIIWEVKVFTVKVARYLRTGSTEVVEPLSNCWSYSKQLYKVLSQHRPNIPCLEYKVELEITRGLS